MPYVIVWGLLTRDMPYELRVSVVLDWLRDGIDGHLPDFITLYFSKVDEAGHESGPASLEVSYDFSTYVYIT